MGASCAEGLRARLAIGVIAGVRRSQQVAASLHENSVTKVINDAFYLFDWYGPTTIPAGRREAGLSRLSALGIQSVEQLKQLMHAADDIPPPRQFILNRETRSALFLAKYDYASF